MIESWLLLWSHKATNRVFVDDLSNAYPQNVASLTSYGEWLWPVPTLLVGQVQQWQHHAYRVVAPDWFCLLYAHGLKLSEICIFTLDLATVYFLLDSLVIRIAHYLTVGLMVQWSVCLCVRAVHATAISTGVSTVYFDGYVLGGPQSPDSYSVVKKTYSFLPDKMPAQNSVALENWSFSFTNGQVGERRSASIFVKPASNS